MKKYLPVVVAAVLVAAGLGFWLSRDTSEKPSNTETVSTSSSDDTNNTNSASQNNSEQSSAGDSTASSISIENFAFAPSTTTVKLGTKVTWTNNDSVAHTVTSDSGNTLDSKLLSQGETFSFTFTQPGTYTYHCAPHPQMKGTVVVTE